MQTAKSKDSFVKKVQRSYKVIALAITVWPFLFKITIQSLTRAIKSGIMLFGGSMVSGFSPGLYIRKRDYRLLFRMIATLLICLLLINNISWASGGEALIPSQDRSLIANTNYTRKIDIDKLEIPLNLGRIEDRYKDKNERIIIHIQDAHCNYAAQHKIADIIEYLHKEYSIDTVNLEGGKGEYDLSIFTSIYDKKIREKVADYFVKEGLVNGAEYFAINNPDKVHLWGVEDTGLYLKNLNVYRESLKHKEEIEKYLKELDHIISNLKRHIYNAELLELDRKYAEYKAEKLEFKDYLTYLIQKAGKKEVDIKTLTNIYLLKQSLQREDEIDFKAANIERNNLIDEFEKMLSKNAIEELVQKTVQFKAEQISQKDYYAYLVKKANQMNFDLKNYPEFQKYIVYISTYEAIDKAKVMEELRVLESRLKESIFENDDQKRLDTLSKNLILTKNIFNISISKEDYEYYKKNEKFFAIMNYESFINKKAPIYKITAKLDNNINSLDRYRKDITKFYDYSFKRDKAFLENIKFGIPNIRTTQYAPRNTILITGGFHTENLSELFKKRNISYVSIMPEFDNTDECENQYFKLLSSKQSHLVKALSKNVSSLALYSDFCENAEQIYGKDLVEANRLWVILVSALYSEEATIVVGKRLYTFNQDDNALPIDGAVINGKQIFAKRATEKEIRSGTERNVEITPLEVAEIPANTPNLSLRAPVIQTHLNVLSEEQDWNIGAELGMDETLLAEIVAEAQMTVGSGLDRQQNIVQELKRLLKDKLEHLEQGGVERERIEMILNALAVAGEGGLAPRQEAPRQFAIATRVVVRIAKFWNKAKTIILPQIFTLALLLLISLPSRAAIAATPSPATQAVTQPAKPFLRGPIPFPSLPGLGGVSLRELFIQTLDETKLNDFDYLVSKLDDKNEKKHHFVIELLERCDDPRVFDVLVDLVEKRKNLINALCALAGSTDQRGIDYLISILERTDMSEDTVKLQVAAMFASRYATNKADIVPAVIKLLDRVIPAAYSEKKTHKLSPLTRAGASRTK